MSGINSSSKYAAELIGTFVLVLIGCGSAVFALGWVGISFAFGLSLLAMAYTLGGISGCHINPAVTISMLATRKIKPTDAAIYILMQCIGAIIGALTLYWVALGSPTYSLANTGSLGQNGYAPYYGSFPPESAFVAEIVLTFIFLLVIHGSTSEKAAKGFGGISIGFSLVFIHLVGIPITGTSVNPARSLGPALIVGIFGRQDMTAINQLWLFWAAPVIGALLAAAVWRLLEQTN